MPLSFSHRYPFLVVNVLLLCGCATSAPDIPPHFDHTNGAADGISNILTKTPKSIKVSKPAWQELTSLERDFIQKKYNVDVLEVDSYGIIIDSQSADESTSGTTGVARLLALHTSIVR